MAGSTESAKKAAASNKKKYGSDFYTRIGKLGGSHKHPLKGFGSDHDKAAEAGRLGGLRSKAGHKMISMSDGGRLYIKRYTDEV